MDASQAFVCALLKRTSCVWRNLGAEDPSVVVGWAGHCGRGLCSANKSWAAQKSVIAASNASSSSLSSSAAAATPPALPDLTQRVDGWLDPPPPPLPTSTPLVLGMKRKIETQFFLLSWWCQYAAAADVATFSIEKSFHTCSRRRRRRCWCWYSRCPFLEWGDRYLRLTV